MRKPILNLCIFFFAILYSASLLFAGREEGKHFMFFALMIQGYPRTPDISNIVIAIAQLVLLLCSIYLRYEVRTDLEAGTPAEYCLFAIVTLICNVFIGVVGLMAVADGRYFRDPELVKAYYWVFLALSIVIAILYFIAAHTARKKVSAIQKA